MELMINGVKRSCDFPANAFAIYALRNDLDLKGVRMGCGDGHCGACTVLVDGVPTTSCNLPFGALEGKQITTPEGVGTPDQPHPVPSNWALCAIMLSTFSTPRAAAPTPLTGVAAATAPVIFGPATQPNQVLMPATPPLLYKMAPAAPILLPQPTALCP